MRYSKKMREQALMTINELADKANVSIRTITRIESGSYKLSDKMNILLLRAVLSELTVLPVVKEERAVYLHPFTTQIYSKLSEKTKQTITIEELDAIVRDCNQQGD
ncbi:MAG: helix-turn-helix domain-containing protein [Culicoidibacterales bacterium]